MKTYNQTVKVLHARSSIAGYGHQRISVQLMSDDGRTKDFTATTNNMPGFDAADELEGQERNETLYELIAGQIADQVAEWLDS